MAPTQDVSTATGSRSPASATRRATTPPCSPASPGGPSSAPRWPSIFRSVPLALAVGFAWAGPFENIVVDSWDAGYRYFPGQVLASLIRGGTPELAFGRAVVTATIYTAIAAAVGAACSCPAGT